MKLWAKVRQVWQTAVSDLFSEESETAVSDPVADLIRQTQQRLDALQDELAQALVRHKRAETAWRTAQAQGRSDTDTLAEQQKTFALALAAVQVEIERLQTLLTELTIQSGQLTERAESVAMIERLQTLRAELDKTAVTLHHELEERQEQIARREDYTAARDDVYKRSL
ncbi:MAG: hypothetical protein KBE23_04145 [Chloroflexi bacterium]|nr:hypothetical protein [Chloroflexota bacterium]MBP7041906.1 hypothetical protein [Chloroflexota bacterium]